MEERLAEIEQRLYNVEQKLETLYKKVSAVGRASFLDSQAIAAIENQARERKELDLRDLRPEPRDIGS